MRATDLILLPLAALGQQKLRATLTTLGVIFGAFVLAASLSIGEGVQRTIDRETQKEDFSRKVTVTPRWEVVESKSKEKEKVEVEVEGTMAPDRRERIRKTLEAQAKAGSPDRLLTRLTRERFEALGRLPHVARAIPIVQESGMALLGNRPEGTGIYSTTPEDSLLRKRIIAGRGFTAADERGVLVSEMLAYRMGIASDADLRQLIGKPLRLELPASEFRPGFNVSLRKFGTNGLTEGEQKAVGQLAEQLPATLDRFDLTDEEVEVLRKALGPGTVAQAGSVAGDFPVVGVFRQATDEERKEYRGGTLVDSGLALPHRTALEFYLRDPGRREDGLDQVVLIADSEKDVKGLVEAVKGVGLDGRSYIEFIERERFMYLLIFGGMTCVAAVALLVSALGIANTMLMSVLERRKEIGIMKAVGADNWHLQAIFILEGGLIGIVGAGAGLLLAYGASFPGDAYVRSMVARDMKIDLSGSIFAFPPWIGVTVLVFTVGMTALASFYPAHHAARVDPVTALRNE